MRQVKCQRKAGFVVAGLVLHKTGFVSTLNLPHQNLLCADTKHAAQNQLVADTNLLHKTGFVQTLILLHKTGFVLTLNLPLKKRLCAGTKPAAHNRFCADT